MDIKFAHLCDYAIVSGDGKLSVLGIFQTINVPQLPATHPVMCLAYQLEASYAEGGRPFTLEVRCVDADGRPVFGMQGQGLLQAVPGQAKPGEKLLVNQILGMQNLFLRRTGAHDINIFINNTLKITVSFEVKRIEPPPSPGTPTS